DAGLEKLLLYYRWWSSTLEPALELEITKTANIEEKNVTYTRKEIPITHLTAAQKKSLEAMREISHPALDDKEISATSFHSKAPLAFQKANAAMHQLAKRDGHGLAAQMRYHIPPGLKNAYIAFETLQIAGEEKPEKRYTVRLGSPVYVGKHTTAALQLAAAKQNLIAMAEAVCEQLNKDKVPADKIKKIHLHHLVTPSGPLNLNSETTMVDILRQACKAVNADDSSIKFIYASTPVNGPGSMMAAEMKDGSRTSSRAARLADLADSINQVDGDTLAAALCASGQDRTMSAFLGSTKRWIAEKIFPEDSSNENQEKAMQELVVGSNFAPLGATFRTPGSYGVKSGAFAWGHQLSLPDYLDAKAKDQVHNESISKTNKLVKIHAGLYQGIANQSSRVAEHQLNISIAELKKVSGEDNPNAQLFFEIVQAQRDKIPTNQPAFQNTLRHCVTTTTALIKSPNDNHAKTQVQRMAAHINQTPFWGKVAVGMIIVALSGFALLAVLCAAHTGGLSLLVATHCLKTAAALMVSTKAAAAGTGAAGTAAAGGITYSGKRFFANRTERNAIAATGNAMDQLLNSPASGG
ncbi:MAG: hypothetical protein K0U12_03275, partial [Gammaproteobacteria bacterium]|nr:hypothetical protein [Gammaproteobacteria bacterium]